MSWFGNLFGTATAVDNLLDNEKGLIVRAGTAIGNLHYSEQEKAINAKEVQEWSIRFLDAMAPFKVVQRVLAFSTMFAWLFLIINIAFATWLKAYTTTTVIVNGVATVTVGIDAVGALTSLAFSDFVFYPVMAIFILYTGGGTINSLRGAK